MLEKDQNRKDLAVRDWASAAFGLDFPDLFNTRPQGIDNRPRYWILRTRLIIQTGAQRFICAREVIERFADVIINRFPFERSTCNRMLKGKNLRGVLGEKAFRDHKIGVRHIR